MLENEEKNVTQYSNNFFRTPRKKLKSDELEINTAVKAVQETLHEFKQIVHTNSDSKTVCVCNSSNDRLFAKLVTAELYDLPLEEAKCKYKKIMKILIDFD